MTTPDATHPAPPATPTLRGERVYLRPAERSDLPNFVRWFADGETTHYLLARAPFSAAAEDKWFEGMLERHGKSDWFFVICVVEDGRPIGTAGLHQVNLEDGHAAFGISIGEKAEWNKGYGTDALLTICDFGFGQLRLERIWLDVYRPNQRAQRSYAKAGFTLEGARRNAIFSDGRHHDVLVMSLLRDEWLAQPRRKTWERLPGQQPD
jgi:RimJ/RimL family protein N-acetyltransferase